MRNLRGTIFYMKTNVLQDFHICISVPLNTLNFLEANFMKKKWTLYELKIHTVTLYDHTWHSGYPAFYKGVWVDSFQRCQ